MDNVVYNVPSPTRLYIYKGTANNLNVTVYGNCKKLNLTGATAYFTVKRRLSDNDSQAVIAKISPATVSIVDETEGLVKIPLIASDTINFPDWYYEYIYDLQVVDVNNNTVISSTGTLGVYPTTRKGS